MVLENESGVRENRESEVSGVREKGESGEIVGWEEEEGWEYGVKREEREEGERMWWGGWDSGMRELDWGERVERGGNDWSEIVG